MALMCLTALAENPGQKKDAGVQARQMSKGGRITTTQRKAAAAHYKSLATEALGAVAAAAPPAVMDQGGITHYFGPYPNWAFSPLPTGPVAGLMLSAGGTGYTAPQVTIEDVYSTGAGATASATVTNGVITGLTLLTPGAGYSAPRVVITDPTGTEAAASAIIGGTLNGGIRKFIDSLPGLGAANANNRGQFIPQAVPDVQTYPGADYYEIALIEYEERFSTDLPPTRQRGYVQLATAVIPGAVALANPNGSRQEQAGAWRGNLSLAGSAMRRPCHCPCRP
jgi:hypothetical protein